MHNQRDCQLQRGILFSEIIVTLTLVSLSTSDVPRSLRCILRSLGAIGYQAVVFRLLRSAESEEKYRRKGRAIRETQEPIERSVR